MKPLFWQPLNPTLLNVLQGIAISGPDLFSICFQDHSMSILNNHHKSEIPLGLLYLTTTLVYIPFPQRDRHMHLFCETHKDTVNPHGLVWWQWSCQSKGLRAMVLLSSLLLCHLVHENEREQGQGWGLWWEPGVVVLNPSKDQSQSSPSKKEKKTRLDWTLKHQFWWTSGGVEWW